VKFILDGERPAKVPPSVIDDLKSREHNGYVVLPQAGGLRRGDRVRILRGPFADQIALYEGQAAAERVAVLALREPLSQGNVGAIPQACHGAYGSWSTTQEEPASTMFQRWSPCLSAYVYWTPVGHERPHFQYVFDFTGAP
jgi:hypothetical protein